MMGTTIRQIRTAVLDFVPSLVLYLTLLVGMVKRASRIHASKCMIPPNYYVRTVNIYCGESGNQRSGMDPFKLSRITTKAMRHLMPLD